MRGGFYATIVFGHTHSPNYFRFGEGELSDMTFVNSGSWVRPDNAADKKTADVPYNTTVYVDSKRPIIYNWDDELRTLKAMEQSPLRPRFEHKRV